MRIRDSFYSRLKVIVFAVFSMTLAACATVEGMGEDIEEAGEEIQEASES